MVLPSVFFLALALAISCLVVLLRDLQPVLDRLDVPAGNSNPGRRLSCPPPSSILRQPKPPPHPPKVVPLRSGYRTFGLFHVVEQQLELADVLRVTRGLARCAAFERRHRLVDPRVVVPCL